MTRGPRDATLLAAMKPATSTPLVYQASDFARLDTQFLPTLFQLAKTKIGEEEVAKDIVQNVFVTLVRDARERPAAAAEASFLKRIVSRRCVDEIRHRQMQRSHASKIHAHSAAGRTETDDPAEIVGSKEEPVQHAFDAYIKTLSVRQREVAVLFFQHELAGNVIAKKLNVSAATISTDLKAIRRGLQLALEHLV